MTAFAATSFCVCHRRGCETNEADFQTRVDNIKAVISDVVEIDPECYDESGARDDFRFTDLRCTKNFPTTVQIELAAHIERGLLVEGASNACDVYTRVGTSFQPFCTCAHDFWQVGTLQRIKQSECTHART